MQRLFETHFDLARISFSLLISSFKIEIDPKLSSLITALFFISLAHYANLRVERVSPNEFAEGEMLAMIKVFELPPNESQSKNVNLESQ